MQMFAFDFAADEGYQASRRQVAEYIPGPNYCCCPSLVWRCSVGSSSRMTELSTGDRIANA
eukprot:1568060-Rhodomonas_salina.4